jgi:molecular chaperone GrpE
MKENSTQDYQNEAETIQDLENSEKNTENLQENEQSTENQNEKSAEQNFSELEEKYNALNDNYLRLMAEYDNYRKRTIREKAELIRNGGENVVLPILAVVDNFERALKSTETATEISAVREGDELIYQQLIATLKQQGVKEIDTENVDFDTEFHEAITTIPAPSESQKGKVIDCTQKGYLMNDKVIRHAKVVVGE